MLRKVNKSQAAQVSHLSVNGLRKLSSVYTSVRIVEIHIRERGFLSAVATNAADYCPLLLLRPVSSE